MIGLDNNNSFLGTGMKFPVQVDKTTGRFKMSSDEEDIKESIYIILMTQKGERLLLPNFGSRINDYVFEVMDQTTLTLMANDIKSSIANYEKRIKDLEVFVEIDKDNTSKLILNIRYKVAQNNSVGNLVFPFYLQEGVGESNVG